MKTIIIIIVLIGASIVGLLLFQGKERDTSTSLSDNAKEQQLDKAPNFSLEDYDGSMVALSDFNGKIVVVNSWAVWCPFCKKELADFALLQEEFKNDIVVIAIDRQESLEKAKEFTDSDGITNDLIFLLDPSDSFYKSIGGFSMPETIFVDKEGNIVIHKRGPMEFEEMKEKIMSML